MQATGRQKGTKEPILTPQLRDQEGLDQQKRNTDPRRKRRVKSDQRKERTRDFCVRLTRYR